MQVIYYDLREMHIMKQGFKIVPNGYEATSGLSHSNICVLCVHESLTGQDRDVPQ